MSDFFCVGVDAAAIPCAGTEAGASSDVSASDGRGECKGVSNFEVGVGADGAGICIGVGADSGTSAGADTGADVGAGRGGTGCAIGTDECGTGEELILV